MILFTIARGRPRGGAGIVRQMPYLSPQLSPGGGGWGISLIGALRVRESLSRMQCARVVLM